MDVLKEDKTNKDFFTYQWIKDNISMITLIHLFIGGLWQAIALSSISVSYLRFFSISQQISDGIITSIVFVIICLPLYLIRKQLKINFNIKYVTNESKKDYIYSISLLLFILLCIVLLFLMFINYGQTGLIYFFTKNEFYFSWLIQVMFFVPFLLIIIKELYEQLYRYVKAFKPKLLLKILNHPLFQRIFSSVLLLIVFILFAFISNKVISFHKKYSVPDNLENFKILKNNVAKTYKTNNVKIIYFNDKYIFISANDKILIQKFDDLFLK